MSGEPILVNVRTLSGYHHEIRYRGRTFVADEPVVGAGHQQRLDAAEDRRRGRVGGREIKVRPVGDGPVEHPRGPLPIAHVRDGDAGADDRKFFGNGGEGKETCRGVDALLVDWEEGKGD